MIKILYEKNVIFVCWKGVCKNVVRNELFRDKNNEKYKIYILEVVKFNYKKWNF